MTRHAFKPFLVATTASLLLAGCIERKETITIESDGSVRMQLAFEAESSAELYTGDAIPRLEDGWLVAESVEVDDEGKETYTLQAEAVFAPGGELPANYGSPRDPDLETYLQFPTELTIEQRRDGTYYHFYRRYEPRAWGFLEEARKLLQEELEGMGDTDFEEMSTPEQARVIELIATFETLKNRAFARRAFKDALPDAPQDAWLAVNAALEETVHGLDFERLLALITEEDEEERDALLEAEAEAFEKAAIKAMQNALRAHPKVSTSAVNTFAGRYNWQKTYYELTEELADDAFRITVAMPGHLVGHNGSAVDGSTAKWELTGEMLRDAEFEIIITSRVQ